MNDLIQTMTALTSRIGATASALGATMTAARRVPLAPLVAARAVLDLHDVAAKLDGIAQHVGDALASVAAPASSAGN